MCAHDHDRFRLPSASPPQKSEAGKKESTDRRLSQAYQRCVTPSSNSSLDCRRNVARTAEGGFATHSGVSKSAKVVRELHAKTQRRGEVPFQARFTAAPARRRSGAGQHRSRSESAAPTGQDCSPAREVNARAWSIRNRRGAEWSEKRCASPARRARALAVSRSASAAKCCQALDAAR